MPNFRAYSKDDWSCLRYIETVVVDHSGEPDRRKMNQADWDAVDTMVADGLVTWGNTGLQPVFGLTDVGWAVAHALRRWRAAGASPRTRYLAAEQAVSHVYTLSTDETATALPTVPTERITPTYTVGTKVARAGDDHWFTEQPGEIIEMTDTRVRIQWFNNDGTKDKRTWMSYKGFGQRWALRGD